MVKVQLVKKLWSGQGGEMNLEVDFTLSPGEVLAIYGPSGAGKTSILRMIAGLMEPNEGVISLDEEVWFDQKSQINLPPQKRSLGLVFQDYALFPHLTARENLEFPLSSKKEKAEQKKWIDRLLGAFHISDLADRKPDTLSGGQKQRVALARSLVRKPRLFLLDEPLSALDRTTRLELQQSILELHQELNLITILVSHNLSEVFRLAGRVLVLDEGKITHQGRPDEVFIRGQVSGKFRFAGEVVQIEQDEVVYLVTVLIGQHAVQVVASPEEAKRLKVGDAVVLVSKAFNPMILPEEKKL